MQRRSLLAAVIGAGMNLPAPFARAQSTPALSAADQALISQVQTYLNGLTAITANFLQVAADGATRTGKAWLQRPGKMRFEYDPPDKMLLVAGHGLRQATLPPPLGGADTIILCSGR